MRIRPESLLRGALLTGLLLVVGVQALAQPLRHEGAEEPFAVDAAGSENALWVAKIGRDGSILFSRSAGAQFDEGRFLNRQISTMVGVDQELFCFFDGGAVYRYTQDQLDPVPEKVLSDDSRVIDASSANGGVYAIVESDIARKAASAPADERSGPNGLLSVVLYDGLQWRFIADCPDAVRGPTSGAPRPRLTLDGDRLFLFWHNARKGQIDAVSRGLTEEEWSMEPSLPTPRPSGMWATRVGGLLTLVVSSRKEGDTSDADAIAAYRLLRDTDSAARSWRAAKLQISELPPDAAIVSYRRAFGFNQQLAMLVNDASGEVWLIFARAGEPSTEPSLRVRDLLIGPSEARRLQDLWSQAAFLLLLVVLMGLFALRRDSMMKEAILPAGFQHALRIQRGAAWVIDFAPFTIICAYIMNLPWWESLREIAGWALNPDPQAGLPSAKVIGWWVVSCATHATYCMIMEWLTRRTVGKALLGMSLLTEIGTSPSLGQIAARNGLRLIELIPQFWVFIVLLFASRNRQRLGDIFSRTVVVRRSEEAPSSGAGNGGARDDDGPNDPDAV